MRSDLSAVRVRRSPAAAGLTQRIRSLLPLRHRLAVAHAVEVARAKLGRWRVRCPVCGGRFRAFLPAGLVNRQNARCPRCGALERHRLQWLFLRENTNLFASAPRVLHLAPEPGFSSRLASLCGSRYITADIGSGSVDVMTDITNLAFRDACFDVILCSHVLEHVPDDAAAMAELHRALSRSGWALIQVPLDESRAETFEDPSVVDPQSREQLFGQWDHVRLYGRDYAERLKLAGFEVHESRFAFELDHRVIAMYGLVPEPLFMCHSGNAVSLRDSTHARSGSDEPAASESDSPADDAPPAS